ncbi:uncharacterized protein EV154DRAFT_494619 [Mucor mucedo]|uniref:uncharacterized protein n=1 Tax=Mucor mucedo TaxID=29922 RepID=UPI0022206793|nr:uncharacterized protein EV154DRAFT_494619 [Mucor mucedo]KAI7895692.1 hypothetical protein EV154DRAFT_494619 [Mucor mucedo]
MLLSYKVATFLFLISVSHAKAQAVEAKTEASCGYLNRKIYCFGGKAQVNSIAGTSTVMLDIFNSSGITADEFTNHWVTVAPITNGLDIRGRSGIATVSLPDEKTMLLLGGGESGSTKLASQMLAFNGETVSWQGYPDYTEEPYGVREIYFAAASYIPDHGVALYGGLQANFGTNYVVPGVNISDFLDNVANVGYFGFTSLTFLDISNPSNPWSVYPTQTNKPGILSRCQTSIYDSKTSRIFYFGGRYQTPPSVINEQFTFNKSMTFDVTKGEWGTQTLSGTEPIERMGHSTTLIGPNKRDVLLYGGNSNLVNQPIQVRSDYCFTLNLDTFQWTRQSIEAKSNPILIRTKHSAVVVDNDTVFILFGIDTNENPILPLLTLNVSNPLKVTWLEKYVSAAVMPNTNSTSVDESTNTKSADESTYSNSTGEAKLSTNSKLSTGAIVGIAVGAAVVGVVATIIYFCLIRKRKAEKKRLAIEEKGMHQRNEPLMEVNWDEIDKKYVEDPTNSTGEGGYPLQSSNHISSGGNTMVHNDKLQRPHAFGENILPGVNVIQLAQKPCGI